MRRIIVVLIILAVVPIASACVQRGGEGGRSTNASGAPSGWGSSSEWVVPSRSDVKFVREIDNPYWPFARGNRWTYETKTDEETETNEVLVLDEPRELDGVPCVVVRDTVMIGDALKEDTYDWYAQDTAGNVWYMGEDTKEYEDGEVVSTEGSWEAGVDGASAGIVMWADPDPEKPPYYQEYYRGEAEDLGKVIGFSGTAKTPEGDFDNLLVIEEWTPLEPEIVVRKYYAKDIGFIMEEAVRGPKESSVLTSFSGR